MSALDVVWVDGWGSRRHIRDPEHPDRGLCGACGTNPQSYPKRKECVRCLRIVGLPSLEDAARAYIAARLANDAAEPSDWTARAAEVDRTWHELLTASDLAPSQEKP